MKDYKTLKKELLQNKQFYNTYSRVKPLYDFLNSVIKIRVKKQISLYNLEKLSGISYNTLNQIESGEQDISYQTMQKIATALDCELKITLEEK